MHIWLTFTCFCLYVCLSVTLSTKWTKFGSKCLVHKLSEQDEIWHTVRPGLTVRRFQDRWNLTQGVPWGAKIHVGKKIITLFSYLVWRSATTFGSVRGLVNRRLFPEFGELWSRDTTRRHASFIHWWISVVFLRCLCKDVTFYTTMSNRRGTLSDHTRCVRLTSKVR